MTASVYRWTTSDERGLEHLAVKSAAGGITARSAIIAPGGKHAFTYHVVCDEAWRTLSLSVAEIGGRALELRSNGHGVWQVDGRAAPALDLALDIDLSASPFTNTLPIRRHPLDVGASVEIVTAFVAFPDLDVQPGPQRYTRLSDRTYLFESLDEDFEREITVDDEGFVLDYPGLFRRVMD